MLCPVLLAQGIGAEYSLGQIAIGALIVFGVLAIAYAVIKHLGVTIPPLFVTIFWIVVAVFLGIVGIRILLSL